MLDSKVLENFRVNAALVGERTAAFILLEYTKEGKINMLSGGGLVEVGGLIQAGQVYYSKLPAFGPVATPGEKIAAIVNDAMADLAKTPPPELIPIDPQIELPLPIPPPPKPQMLRDFPTEGEEAVELPKPKKEKGKR